MQIITYTTKTWLKTPLVLWVAISTIFMLTGAYFVFNMNKANAAALTDVSDVLSSSAPLANSNHTVTFTLAAALVPDDAGGSTILVEWDTLGTTDEFDFTGIVIGDVDISGSTVDQTLAANCTGAEDVGFVVNTTT